MSQALPAPPVTRPTKRPRTRNPPAATIYDTARGTYSLLARSCGPVDRCSSIALSLTAPEPDEECSIAMELMAVYRLPFVPATFAKAHVVKNQPLLTKATLPCGHSFSALAIIYHFAKNSMTCPCCRAGHVGERMGEQSVPAHMRRFFVRHLAQDRNQEVREQITNDAMVAARMLHHEVSYEILSLPVTRMVLSLSAYSSMDRSTSPEPMLVLESPLTSSLATGLVESVSSGYSLHQLNLNLRLLPVRCAAFELSVGVRSLHHHDWNSVGLFKTIRFDAAPVREGVRVVPGSGGDPRLKLEVQMLPSADGDAPQFARITWRVGVQGFTDLLISTSHELMLAPAGGEIAAV